MHRDRAVPQHRGSAFGSACILLKHLAHHVLHHIHVLWWVLLGDLAPLVEAGVGGVPWVAPWWLDPIVHQCWSLGEMGALDPSMEEGWAGGAPGCWHWSDTCPSPAGAWPSMCTRHR